MFSEKYGYKPEMPILSGQISNQLRHKIWNLFYQQEINCNQFDVSKVSKRMGQVLSREQTIEEKIVDKIEYFIDYPLEGSSTLEKLKDGVLNSFSWFEVYDFIEIYLSFLEGDNRNERTKQYNKILEHGKSGYRIIAGEVVPLMGESEIQCIEQAATTPYYSVNQHIQKALSRYSDRNYPDYENSIKESICAVEAVCCIITGMSGQQATLGSAIKKLKEKDIHIHGAMEKAFLALYGYASDEDGIRHGGIDFQNVPAEDAKYMLISCSAFVNYLIEKWEKTNSEGVT